MTVIKVDITRLQTRLAGLSRGFDPSQFTRALGGIFLRWIDQNFKEQGKEKKWAPLSPNTIAGRRGGGAGAQALQDTGRLKQSFSVLRDTGEEVTVGTNLSYASIHHKGTGPYQILPQNARALRYMTTGGYRFAKRVNHPGIPARPLIPSDRLARDIATTGLERMVDALVRRYS